MRDYCDAQAGFWLNSKFWSKFSRPKFTPEYPPPHLENFRFGMTKVYSRIPPQFGKLQIWDDQSLLRNTPPHFAMYYGSYYMMTSGGFLCILGKLICILGNFNIFPHLLLRHTQAHKEGVTYWYVLFFWFY